MQASKPELVMPELKEEQRIYVDNEALGFICQESPPDWLNGDKKTDFDKVKGHAINGFSERFIDGLVGKIAQAAFEIALTKAQSAAILKRKTSALNTLHFLFGRALDAYTRTRLDGQTVKSINLQHGTLKCSSIASSPKVVDEEALLSYLICCPGEQANAIMQFAKDDEPLIKSYANTAAVIAYCRATGEELPGIKMSDAHSAVSICIPGAGKDGKALSIKLDLNAKPETDEEAESFEDAD